jgi:hypothetical protein
MPKYKLIKEKWKPVIGYEGLYEVSNKGRIKTLDKSRGHKEKIKYILINNQTGYRQVLLCKENKKKTYKVARLVAQAFIPNKYNRKTVNHKDYNRINDNVENLEWMSSKENSIHSYLRPRKFNNRKGENHPSHRFTDKQILKIRGKYIPRIYTTTKLAKEYKTSQSLIWSIVKRKIWTHV